MTPQDPPQNSHEQTRKLDRHFAGGLAWTAGAKWATQLASWASLLALARLLSKADFGIGEMAGMYLVLTNMVAEFGVGTAVLHMPELSRRALGQLHAFSCVLCSAIFGISILVAPFIAQFFHTPQLTTVIIVGNFAFLLTGFQAVPLGLLQRDMDYRKLSIAEAAQAIAQAVVGVLFAWLGWGYWALILGGHAGKIVNTVLVSNWKRVPFAMPWWNDIRIAVGLGRQIAIGRLAWSAYSYSDGVIVGRVLGDSVLGTYRMAMNLASAPADKVSTLLMRTAGPLFANVQSDLPLVRRYFRIFAEALSLTVMPLMTGLVMLAPDAVPVVLGQQWKDAVAPLQWLAAFMMLRTMGILMDQVLISQRATKLTMRMSLLNFVVMPIAFYFSAHAYGTVGVAASWLALAPLTILPSQIIMLRRIHLPFRDFAAVLWPAIASSTVMALAVYSFRLWLAHRALPVIAGLGLEIALGGAIYVLFLLVVFRPKVLRYVNFIHELRARKSVLASEPAVT